MSEAEREPLQCISCNTAPATERTPDGYPICRDCNTTGGGRTLLDLYRTGEL